MIKYFSRLWDRFALQMPTPEHLVLSLLAATVTETLPGKGLDEISEQNPSNQPPPTPIADPPVPQPTTVLSQNLSGTAFIATSVGFVGVSKSTGTWKSGGGATDIYAGYQAHLLNDKFPIFATYRYTPIAVSGREKNHEYRGVWENHALGALGKYPLTPEIDGLGGAELGLIIVHLQPTDSLEEKKEAEKNGISFTILGGLEYKMLENRLSVGPKLHLGFGSTSVYQFALSASFYL